MWEYGDSFLLKIITLTILSELAFELRGGEKVMKSVLGSSIKEL